MFLVGGGRDGFHFGGGGTAHVASSVQKDRGLNVFSSSSQFQKELDVCVKLQGNMTSI